MEMFVKLFSEMANSVDPDQTAPSGKEPSDQGLYCLQR